MTPHARVAFHYEMKAARACYRDGDLDAAFAHLERAHILGQRDTLRHTWSHGWMLRVGWARRDGREIRGQLLRLVGALLISRIWVPLGNTGGANVSPVQPMPLPDDLRRLLEEAPRG
ncbi:MAG: DUF3703 domain-containing protein [Pseudomonadota bacterium]